MMHLEKLIIVCGHYGSGKTNFSLNLAGFLAGRGEPVTVVDLDIVNPYFRAHDFKDQMSRLNIRNVSPRFHGTTLDIPGIVPDMHAAVNSPGYVIFDVGGDDAGATALGRFSQQIRQRPYHMLYVVNRNRGLIRDPGEALTLMREIESASRLKCTHIVGNTHLNDLTDSETVLGSLEYNKAVASAAGLPVMCVTAPTGLIPKLQGKVENLFPVERLVLPPF